MLVSAAGGANRSVEKLLTVAVLRKQNDVRANARTIKFSAAASNHRPDEGRWFFVSAIPDGNLNREPSIHESNTRHPDQARKSGPPSLEQPRHMVVPLHRTWCGLHQAPRAPKPHKLRPCHRTHFLRQLAFRLRCSNGFETQVFYADLSNKLAPPPFEKIHPPNDEKNLNDDTRFDQFREASKRCSQSFSGNDSKTYRKLGCTVSAPEPLFTQTFVATFVPAPQEPVAPSNPIASQSRLPPSLGPNSTSANKMRCDPRASYMAYGYSSGTLIRRRVKYDLKKSALRYRKAGVPTSNSTRLSKAQ